MNPFRIRNIVDTLQNLVSSLGTPKDKAFHDQFVAREFTRAELDAAYRSDWIARKIVDVPAFDATRAWRNWQAEEKQIEAIEATERRLGVQQKIARALKLARLHGGSLLVIGAGGEQTSSELKPDAVRKDALLYLHVLSRYAISTEEIETDPASPWFGEPKAYKVRGAAGTEVSIHPSRAVRFIGAERTDEQGEREGWGDSVLQPVGDAVRNAALASQSVASLLHEAKIDVIGIPNLSNDIASADYRSNLITRFATANQLKSLHNAMLLDKEEEWNRKQTSFSSMPELVMLYLQIASGAADIPATRLLGQSPGGMNATGDADLRNYYDRIAADQNLMMRPALSRLDEALIRSALGSRPPEVYYEFAPLWQISETERADIAVKRANAAKTLADSAIIPDEALGRAVANQMIESGDYPGLDQSLKELGAGGKDIFAAMAEARAAEQDEIESGGEPVQ